MHAHDSTTEQAPAVQQLHKLLSTVHASSPSVVPFATTSADTGLVPAASSGPAQVALLLHGLPLLAEPASAAVISCQRMQATAIAVLHQLVSSASEEQLQHSQLQVTLLHIATAAALDCTCRFLTASSPSRCAALMLHGFLAG